MTDPKPHENTGNETHVTNPKPAGQVEKVNPTSGESAGTVNTADTTKR